MTAKYGYEFYTWGGHVYYSSDLQTLSIPTFDIWSFFYIINTGDTSEITTGATTTNTDIFQNSIIATVIILISFICVIISLILGIKGLKSKKSCLLAAISSIIAIIMFMIGMNIAFTIDTGATTVNLLELMNITFTFGFYFIVLSMILFFAAFALYIVFPEESSIPTQQSPQGYGFPQQGFPSDQQPPIQQTQPPVQQAPPPQIQEPTSIQQNQTLRCPDCGTAIEPNMKFCRNCGKQIQ